jgi:hypothetical protein
MKAAAAPAKRSKIDTSGVTSVGICGARCRGDTVMGGAYPERHLAKPARRNRVAISFGRCRGPAPSDPLRLPYDHQRTTCVHE